MVAGQRGKKSGPDEKEQRGWGGCERVRRGVGLLGGRGAGTGSRMQGVARCRATEQPRGTWGRQKPQTKTRWTTGVVGHVQGARTGHNLLRTKTRYKRLRGVGWETATRGKRQDKRQDKRQERQENRSSQARTMCEQVTTGNKRQYALGWESS